MAGPSYMGYTQWAIARDAGPTLKAICTQVTSSEFQTAIHPGGSSDKIIVGKPKEYWRDWLIHTKPSDEWWAKEDYSHTVKDVSAPNHLISGWYDFLLQQLIRDYNSLAKAGHKPYLTIGPWAHSSNGLVETGLRESLIWLRAHLLDEKKALRSSPVRIYVMGAKEWRNLESWPPSNIEFQHWYLHTEEELRIHIAPKANESMFIYDPSNPTPNVGGATNATLAKGTGSLDNRKLEARTDVLTFTSPTLEQNTEIIGPVTAELYVKSSLEYTDFFVRLCDVLPSGKSMNICDGIIRLFPGHPMPMEDGVIKLEIELSPTAYRFNKGNRIRVQVSSGAHPRYARNLGTDEPLATATIMMIAEQRVYHDPSHPSSVILPILI